MKKTLRKQATFFAVLFAAVCFVPSAYSDSFVDEFIMNQLKDFKYGQGASYVTQKKEKESHTFRGDSFVSKFDYDALKDFEYAKAAGERFSNTGAENQGGEKLLVNEDSFVNEYVATQLEGVCGLSFFTKNVDCIMAKNSTQK